MPDDQKTAPHETHEAQLRATELSKAKVDLEIAEKDRDLKQLELEEKTSWGSYIRVVTTNPAFLAAVVTACITAAITLNSEKQSRLQMEAEKARFVQDKDKSILLGITNNLDDSNLIASKLKLFLDTGILEDDTKGTFRTTQHNLEKEFQQKIVGNILSASEDLPIDFGPTAPLNAILRPTSLHTLNYFIQQGFSPELLYWLFFNVITETHPLPYHVIAKPPHDESNDVSDNERGDSSTDQSPPNGAGTRQENQSGAQAADAADNRPAQGTQAQPPDSDKANTDNVQARPSNSDQGDDNSEDANEEAQFNNITLAYEYNPENPAISCNSRRLEQVCFADFVRLFVLMGLTVEERRGESSQGGDIGRLCFDQALAQRAQRIIARERRPAIASARLLAAVSRGTFAISLPKCESPWKKLDGDASDRLVFAIGPSIFKIQLRSTYTVFRFLGQLVASGTPENRIMLSDTGDELLIIKEETPNDQCFLTGEFEGQTYCIPNAARSTKQIIGLLGDSLKLSR